MDLIERCIFILCLDDSIPLSFNHQKSIDETSRDIRDDVSLATQMLHGFGSNVNSCNRWFDKTMQVGGLTVFIVGMFWVMYADKLFNCCYNLRKMAHCLIASTAISETGKVTLNKSVV